MARPVLLALLALVALLLLLACAPHTAQAHSKGKHGGKRSGGKKSKTSSRSRLCKGRSCQTMSDLLPSLAFADGEGPVVECDCADFLAGACFAPGCKPCEKSCFDGDEKLAKMGGPFGTGLLCSFECLPCCQDPESDDVYDGSTCALPAGGCSETPESDE